MLLLIALSACVDEETDERDPRVPEVAATGPALIATAPDRSPALPAPVRKVPPPAGELVVTDCFGLTDDGHFGVIGGIDRRKGGAQGTGGAAPPPSARPDANESRGRQRMEEGQVAQRPAPKPRPAPAPSPMAPMDPAAAAPAPPASEPMAPPKAVTTPSNTKDANRNAQEGDAEKKTDSRQVAGADAIATEREPAKEEAAKPAPVLDWGATVWLSNDDSMSLASAQRVLYALKRGIPLRTSEIRPHELLNYFSFDAAEPTPGRVFSVLGAADQQGETLTVSLAVKGATPEREPLDLTLLVDRSCSMRAEGRMDYTRRGLELMTGQLQQGDRIDLVLFDSAVCTPIQDFVVGRDDPAVLRDTIARIQPHTGTNLDAGLQAAYALQTARDPADVHGRNRRVLLVTDALLNEGRVQESIVAQVGTNLEQHDIRLSGVGVGREFNDAMLDRLTENGKGAYVYLGSEAVVDRVFGPGFDALVRTVAHDVHFALDLPDSLAMERFYGEEASTNKEDVKPIHYFAGTTQLFLQDLRVAPGGLVRADPITMRIEYRDAITGEPQVQELRTTVGALLDGDPHNLRKGRALMAFSDVVLARSMGGDACGAPLEAYRERSSALPEDAEIGFVNGLVGDLCHVPMTTVVARGVQLKLKLDSDQPIANVDLVCGPTTRRERLSPADQVARFADVQPGTCTVELEGNVPMTAEVEVPPTGGDLRCLVRGGRVSCT